MNGGSGSQSQYNIRVALCRRCLVNKQRQCGGKPSLLLWILYLKRASVCLQGFAPVYPEMVNACQMALFHCRPPLIRVGNGLTAVQL